ncbi:hypothetical protein SAMN04488029_3618 [Reichenbachiella faecimaris]|uniref:WG containing repeat-containing protein n=1 Tax=Reichenbachiella faecimaris TaxID=692418 RepID=A0A1W2GN33_REIFA|nr:WG repeat-containing protein [Reichenbachiella faecimaris]SMD38073.1 hypothetical protein SAMN04488029_3618 [Reichenbachiella faecimaris]
MKKGFLFFFIFFLSCVSSQNLFAEKTKQAMRAYEKGDFEKAEDILTKSMEEDSLNPATEYVWALLYSNDAYPKYHLDTAHFYIEFACEHIKEQDEDHLDELEDADLYVYDLKNKKIAIDSMAFAVASTKNDIEAYEHFIQLYNDAADFDQAVTLRNQLVFAEVEAVHTWQVYAGFMRHYPEANQVEKAQIQYDKLIYEDKTRSGKIEDLERFLKEEPSTPYRHSIEKKIFEDYVGELDSDRMIDFFNKYNNPVLATRTLNMLYYLDRMTFSGLENDLKIKSNFMDSVNQLEELNKESLAIALRDENFQFLDLEGRVFLEGSYQRVQDNYKCGSVWDELLAVESEGAKQLINRNGDVIFDGYDGQVEDLGSGLLAVEEGGMVGVIHKSGFRLLSPGYEDLELVENSLLVFEKEGKLGVMSVTGKEYIRPAFDDIYRKGSFWIFQQGENFGVSSREQIKLARDTSFEVELLFEEVELINDKYIIGFLEDAEVLLNHHLEVITPESTRRINTRHETWVIEMDEGYTTFDPELGQLSSNVYQGVLQNAEWLGLTRNGKWFVYNKNIYDEPIIGIDSLKLLGEDIAIVFREKDGLAIFPNKMVVEIVEDQYLKSIGPKIQTDTHYLVVKEGGKNILYKDGIEQFRLECDELGYISDSAFYVKKNGKYGAVGRDGRLIMRIRYDAISVAENNVAPVLYNGKFGAYNFTDRVLLRLDYQEKIKSYNSDLFIVNEDGKYGLLDKYNEIKVEPGYEQIAYWSDSSFLGLNHGFWQIVKMSDGQVVLSDVLYYEFIKDSPSEKILLIRKEEGYGIYHSKKELIIPTVFHDVMNLGNDEVQLYFTETAVPEADIYVVVYYDTHGNKLFSEAYREEVYESLVCED